MFTPIKIVLTVIFQPGPVDPNALITSFYPEDLLIMFSVAVSIGSTTASLRIIAATLLISPSLYSLTNNY